MIDRARGIGTDGTNVYITGQFGSTASFGSHSVTAADSSDVFMAAINGSGDFLWAKSVGGTADAFEDLGYESGNAISASSSGYVFATGALLNGGTFGTISPGAWQRTDVFVTRISQAVGIDELADDGGTIHIYPNPSTGMFTVSASKSNISELRVYNSIGENVFSSSGLKPQTSTLFDISSLEKGVYFIEFKNEEQVIYRHKIILL
jgi:hypothetical protein